MKKKKKIIIIISIVILLLLLIGSLLFIFLNKKNKSKEEQLPDWGQKYYEYLKDFSKESKQTLKENNVEVAKKYQGNLYYYSEEEETPPLLTLDPVEENNYLVVVLLIDGEPREFIIKNEKADIEMLYNIKDEQYYYYFIYQENNQTHFIKLTDYINYLIDNNKKYEEIVINNGEKINVNGEEILKVDTIFMEPNKPEIQFNYNPEEIKGLEDEFKYYIKDVKKTEDLIKDSTKNGVSEKIDKVKSIIIEIEKQQKEPEPDPPAETPSDPETPDPSIIDPYNCTGWNKEVAANPCMCETFTGCINDLFEHEVCGIGYCSSKAPMTEEECNQYGGELSGTTCWTPYK